MILILWESTIVLHVYLLVIAYTSLRLKNIEPEQSVKEKGFFFGGGVAARQSVEAARR